MSNHGSVQPTKRDGVIFFLTQILVIAVLAGAITLLTQQLKHWAPHTDGMAVSLTVTFVMFYIAVFTKEKRPRLFLTALFSIFYAGCINAAVNEPVVAHRLYWGGAIVCIALVASLLPYIGWPKEAPRIITRDTSPGDLV